MSVVRCFSIRASYPSNFSQTLGRSKDTIKNVHPAERAQGRGRYVTVKNVFISHSENEDMISDGMIGNGYVA